MANIDHPHGFEWIKNPHGGSETPRIEDFDAYYATGYTLYRGQCVKLDAAGYLRPVTGTGAGADTHIVGICQRHVVVPDDTVVRGIPVVLCAHSCFRIQMDENFAVTTRAGFMAIIGTDYDMVNPAAGDTLGNSTTELAGAGGGDACTVIWWDERPDNTFGPYMDVIIRFPSDVLVDGPEFVDQA